MPLEERCRILVVGAGPAGIAAACAAAETVSSVVVLDDNPAPGGQIWRGRENPWTRRVRHSSVRIVSGTRAIALPEAGLLLAEQNGVPLFFRYEKLILATGARELFLPFPGWTLPGVTGAGGLQALAQGGLPVRGNRVVVAGSGPLLLEVAAYLRAGGAVVEAIAEQAPFSRLARFAAKLYRAPAKIGQALELQWRLRGVPFLTEAWPIAAEGGQNLEAVLLRTRAGIRRFACEYLACGFGLIPNIELPALAGCELRDGFVAVDEWQQTSAGSVLCAGETTGIGGANRSLVEGRIAGHAAAGARQRAARLFRARARMHRFSADLARCFALREELKHLALPETIVCRCEDVRFESAAGYGDPRGAKLDARCGMGPCQGRVCGPALHFALGWPWPAGHARPPLFPARMATLAATRDEEVPDA
jgi:NADPH-dependent 2,4-dienoyl-CoA reductase/sulfur reductase-like enzyme